MKASLLVLGLLSAAVTQAATAEPRPGSLEIVIGLSHGSIVPSFPSPPSYASEADADTSESEEEISADDKVTAAWALHNVSDDALDLAEDFKDNPGIGNTTAGTYLSELAADTKPLKSAVARLADLLDRNASQDELDKEIQIIEDRYADIRSGHQKAATQLYVQGKPSEGYQIRTAYTKIRSRWVYLQGLLN